MPFANLTVTGADKRSEQATTVMICIMKFLPATLEPGQYILALVR